MAKKKITKRSSEPLRCKQCGKEFFPFTSSIAPKFCSRACYKESRKKNPVKRPNNTPSKTKADNLWSKLVKKRAGERCEYCGKREVLNSHHIFSRSNYSTRWDLDNGVCLCVSHHVFGVMSFHKSPVEMLEWIKEHRGDAWYENLRRKARDVSKSTRDILAASYHELLEKSKDFT